MKASDRRLAASCPAGKVHHPTGSRPHVPAIRGLESLIRSTSTSALELTALASLHAGSSARAISVVELAQLFAARRILSSNTWQARRWRCSRSGRPEVLAALEGYLADEAWHSGLVACKKL